MKYNILGTTGVVVSELCFGTMTFGGTGGHWAEMGALGQLDVDALIKTAYSNGINFFDTANAYSRGEAEKLFGQSLRNSGINRNDVVVATKVRLRMGEGQNNVGLSRLHIMQSIDESLQRLNMGHVDILYVHGVDPHTPVEETMRAINDVIVSGKVRYAGICNWPAWKVMQAQGIAEKNGWNKFAALQYFYSLAGRDIEREIIPMALDQKLPLLPWSPLAGGFLSGKFTRSKAKAGNSRRDTFDFPPVNKEKAYDVVDALIEIGREHGTSAAAIGLAWVRHQRAVTSTIIGARAVKQLEENISSTNITLSAGQLNKLDSLSALTEEYPGWMVRRQAADRTLGDR